MPRAAAISPHTEAMRSSGVVIRMQSARAAAWPDDENRAPEIGCRPFQMGGGKIGNGRDVVAGLLQQKSDGRSDHAGPDHGERERMLFFFISRPIKKGLPRRKEDPYLTVFVDSRLSLQQVIQAVGRFLTQGARAVKQYFFAEISCF